MGDRRYLTSYSRISFLILPANRFVGAPLSTPATRNEQEEDESTSLAWDCCRFFDQAQAFTNKKLLTFAVNLARLVVDSFFEIQVTALSPNLKSGNRSACPGTCLRSI